MEIHFPSCSKMTIAAVGPQCIRIEMQDDHGLPFCMLELSLSQALEISHYIEKNKKPSRSEKNGWVLE